MFWIMGWRTLTLIANYNNTKFDSFVDKYLSQGLIAILRKITQVTAAEREVGERRGGCPSFPPPPTTE